MTRSFWSRWWGTVACAALSACSSKRSEPEHHPQPLPSVATSAPAAPSAAAAGWEAARDMARAVRPSPGDAGRFLFGSPEQRLWGSLSVGRSCDGQSSAAAARQLIQAVALWLAESAPPSVELLETAGWAVGACADRDGEDLLRSWLSAESQAMAPELARAAALGLLTWVDRRGQLSERTQTLLLEAAERTNDPDLLMPLGRAAHLSEAVGAHLLELAAKFLTGPAREGRRQVILALGSAGQSAAEPLAQVLLQTHYSVQERAAAAQALGRLGQEGQRHLGQSVASLLSRGLPSTAQSPLWVPLITALTALEKPETARKELTQLSSLVVPEGEARAAERRRLVWLKCRAAELLAQPSRAHPALAACDPSHGTQQRLARLAVMSHAKIEGERLEEYQTLRQDQDPVVRQAALRLVVHHPELPQRAELLIDALSGADPGSKTLAAQIIHNYPRTVLDSTDAAIAGRLHASLSAILKAPELPQETQAAALAAVGALGALNLKVLVDAACTGSEPSLWSAAEDALRLLGNLEASCPPALSVASPQPSAAPSGAPQSNSSPPQEREQPVVLLIDSDVGPLELHLRPELAPRAVAHLLARVDAGFYDGGRVGFGRPGWTVQFGDRHQDGYDDERAPGLPFEVSPRSFHTGSVGMSSFAPGAENTQLFVTVSDAPQLFGSRIFIGTAKGPWELLVWGDELRRVRRLTK